MMTPPPPPLPRRGGSQRAKDLTPTKVLSPSPPPDSSSRKYWHAFAEHRRESTRVLLVCTRPSKPAVACLTRAPPRTDRQEWSATTDRCIANWSRTSTKAASARDARTCSNLKRPSGNIRIALSTRRTAKCGSSAIHEAASDWGLKCIRYEIRDITPTGIKQAMEMQAEAERIKCTRILSEGKKQAQIIESEGKKTAQIQSEGAMLDVPNRVAEAILSKSEATARGMRLVSEGLTTEGSAKIIDPYVASYGVENPIYAVLQLAETTMRSELGKITLDKTFEERDALNEKIVSAINEATTDWCLKCIRYDYEIRDITPPTGIKQTMEMQAEAERRKRAQILESEAILAKSEATARGMRLVLEAMTTESSAKAASLKLAEQYIETFLNLAQKIMGPCLACYGVENPIYAVLQLAQTAMRSAVGKMTLDKTSERDALNEKIVSATNEASTDWGLKCIRYEIRAMLDVANRAKDKYNAPSKRKCQPSIFRGLGDEDYQQIHSQNQALKSHPQIEELEESGETSPAAPSSEESSMPPLVEEADSNQTFTL